MESTKENKSLIKKNGSPMISLIFAEDPRLTEQIRSYYEGTGNTCNLHIQHWNILLHTQPRFIVAPCLSRYYLTDLGLVLCFWTSASEY